MTTYVQLMIFSPLLNKGIDAVGKRQFQLVIALLLAYHLFSFFRFAAQGSDLLGLATMYLLGRYCKLYGVRVGRRASALLFAGCWAVLSALMLGTHSYLWRYLNYNTPLVMAMAVSLFFFTLSLRPRSSERLNWLLRPTLFIYLITEAIGLSELHFYKWVVDVYRDSLSLGLLATVGTIVGCLMVGQGVMWLVERMVTQRLLDRASGFVSGLGWLHTRHA